MTCDGRSDVVIIPRSSLPSPADGLNEPRQIQHIAGAAGVPLTSPVVIERSSPPSLFPIVTKIEIQENFKKVFTPRQYHFHTKYHTPKYLKRQTFKRKPLLPLCLQQHDTTGHMMT
jgi:hypothetical protein